MIGFSTAGSGSHFRWRVAGLAALTAITTVAALVGCSSPSTTGTPAASSAHRRSGRDCRRSGQGVD